MPEQIASALRWFMAPLSLLGTPVSEIILTLLLSLRFISLVFDEVSGDANRYGVNMSNALPSKLNIHQLFPEVFPCMLMMCLMFAGTECCIRCYCTSHMLASVNTNGNIGWYISSSSTYIACEYRKLTRYNWCCSNLIKTCGRNYDEKNTYNFSFCFIKLCSFLSVCWPDFQKHIQSRRANFQGQFSLHDGHLMIHTSLSHTICLDKVEQHYNHMKWSIQFVWEHSVCLFIMLRTLYKLTRPFSVDGTYSGPSELYCHCY